jgi:excisionase family DNA binding protein
MTAVVAALSRLADAIDRLSAPAPPQLPPEALSVEAAARFIGVSVPTIEHLIRTRRVRYVQLGSQRGSVIPVAGLRQLIEANVTLTGEEELQRRRGRR